MIREHIPQAVKDLWERVRSPQTGRWSRYRYFPHDELVMRYDGRRFRFDTTSVIAKRWFYPRYSDGSIHEPVVSRALAAHLSPESVFIDVGANVGYFTIFAATIANRGHVHAFEVDPRLAAIIYSHFEDDANADTGRVRVVCSAVGDTDRTIVSFSPTQSNNLSTNTIQERHGLERFTSPTLTLDTYCESQGVSPDVIKIDVEGFESHVVDGSSSVIEDIDTMFVEMHPDNLSAYGRSVKELLSDLVDQGFTCRQFVDHRGTGAVDESLTPVFATEPPRENCMVLCTR